MTPKKANLMTRAATCTHTDIPTLSKNFCFLTFKSSESWRYVNMSLHQPSAVLPGSRIMNPASLMARINFSLLKADQSPDPSYSKTSLETRPVLHRRFQHVSLYWRRGQREMKGKEKKRGDEEGNIWFLAVEKLKGMWDSVVFVTTHQLFSPVHQSMFSTKMIDRPQLLGYTILISNWPIKMLLCFFGATGLFTVIFFSSLLFVWQIAHFARLLSSAVTWISVILRRKWKLGVAHYHFICRFQDILAHNKFSGGVVQTVHSSMNQNNIKAIC